MTANEGDSVIRIVIATVIAALVTGGIVLHAVLLKKQNVSANKTKGIFLRNLW